MCCTRLTGNAGRKNSPTIRRLGTIAQLCRAISSQIKARVYNWKKLVKRQYLPHTSPNMVNFGVLAADILSLVWGIPANFNGFRVLAALLHGSDGTVVVGVSQTLRR